MPRKKADSEETKIEKGLKKPAAPEAKKAVVKKEAAKATAKVEKKVAAEKKPAKEKTSPKTPTKETLSIPSAEKTPVILEKKTGSPEKKKTGLKELKTATEEAKKQPVVAEEDVSSTPTSAPIPKIDAQGRCYATGKRKNAIARVWLKPGIGRTLVNGRSGEKYFARPVLQMVINQPLVATNRAGQYDVWCTVAGGGLSGQAGALRHGIGRALLGFEPELRTVLKQGGFLTRDSRIVERKKYGRAKARRRFQFSKR